MHTSIHQCIKFFVSDLCNLFSSSPDNPLKQTKSYLFSWSSTNVHSEYPLPHHSLMRLCCSVGSCAQGLLFPVKLLSALILGNMGIHGREGCCQQVRLCWKAQRSSEQDLGSCCLGGKGNYRVSKRLKTANMLLLIFEKLHLQTVWQGAELSSAMLTQPQSFLLGFRVLCPGEGEWGGEEEASLQAPVRWVLCADRRCNRGWSNGLGTLAKQKRHREG